MRVYIRCIRQILLYSTGSCNRETDSNGSGVAAITFISVDYFLDLMQSIWHHVFKVPVRCFVLLPDFLELMHVVSGAIWRHRHNQKGVSFTNSAATKREDG